MAKVAFIVILETDILVPVTPRAGVVVSMYFIVAIVAFAAGQESTGPRGNLVFFTEPGVVICPIASKKVKAPEIIVAENAP